MKCNPVNEFECLACALMNHIMDNNLIGTSVKDVEVGKDADVLEREISFRWSSQALEQLSAVIADFFEMVE